MTEETTVDEIKEWELEHWEIMQGSLASVAKKAQIKLTYWLIGVCREHPLEDGTSVERHACKECRKELLKWIGLWPPWFE